MIPTTRPDPTLAGRLRGVLQHGLVLPAADPGEPLLQPAAERATGPALLAHAQSGVRARQEARRLYNRCLQQFRERLQRGAEQDDAGLAAAYFVLANLAAASAVDPTAEDLQRVEKQMRQQLGATWREAPLADRQSAFEQFALLGVLMVESAHAARQQGAAARAHVQRAALGYLVQMLGPGAERLALSAEGLVLERVAA